MVEWRRRLEDFRRKGWQNRCEPTAQPSIEYMGLVNREGEEEDRVVVRVHATLDDYVVDQHGTTILKDGASSPQTTLTEWWTLHPPGERWRLLSIEAEAEGVHHLESELIAVPWGDGRVADTALVETAVADALPAGVAVAEIAPAQLDPDARAAALDLALADGRFAPDVLEVAARRAVQAWAEAIDGEDGALEALADRGAIDTLLYGGDASGAHARRRARRARRGADDRRAGSARHAGDDDGRRDVEGPPLRRGPRHRRGAGRQQGRRDRDHAALDLRPDRPAANCRGDWPRSLSLAPCGSAMSCSPSPRASPSPTRRSSRSRCRSCWPSSTRRSRASRRSSASTRSCWPRRCCRSSACSASTARRARAPRAWRSSRSPRSRPAPATRSGCCWPPAPCRRSAARPRWSPAFALLEPGGAAGARGRRLWLGAAVLAAAIGPALGGALTEALSWRWIFFAQAPVAALAAVVALREPRPRRPAAARSCGGPAPHRRPGDRPRARLRRARPRSSSCSSCCSSPAGTSPPCTPRSTVTVIPAGALLGSRIGGDARARAAAGCALVGAGVLALAFLPDAHLLWTVVPQAAAGLGMGLALPALGGELLPERDPQDAARLLVLRHGGIALALVVLAPIVSGNLADRDRAGQGARRRRRARRAAGADREAAPRARPAGRRRRRGAAPRAARCARRPVARRSPPTSTPPTTRSRAAPTTRSSSRSARRSARRSWSPACSACWPRPRCCRGAGRRRWPPRQRPRSPCRWRSWACTAPRHRRPCSSAIRASPARCPQTGGLEGFLQDRALEVLDTTACKVGALARGAGPRAGRRAGAQALRAPPRGRPAQPLHAPAGPARIRTTTTRAARPAGPRAAASRCRSAPPARGARARRARW